MICANDRSFYESIHVSKYVFCYLGKVECADCGNAFRTGYRECYVSPVKILQNIRGNMIYLFRDYIEIPLVGLLHTTGRRFLICKNIKNGNKFCLFLQQ